MTNLIAPLGADIIHYIVFSILLSSNRHKNRVCQRSSPWNTGMTMLRCHASKLLLIFQRRLPGVHCALAQNKLRAHCPLLKCAAKYRSHLPSHGCSTEATLSLASACLPLSTHGHRILLSGTLHPQCTLN